jgi:glycosyltransferase involved in cell wall biosynthesis
VRVLSCHVHYRQAGGEDIVFSTEIDILRRAGIEVSTLELWSADLDALPLREKRRLALRYENHDYGRDLVRAAIREHRPDVVHFHNVYPLIGPGAIVEAEECGRATIQTLHNYRLSCLAGTHLRQGLICERCLPCHFGPGVIHGCYRSSRFQSLLVRRASTRQWRNFVKRGIPTFWLALTPFMKERYVRYGAPAARIMVKTNSVSPGSPVPHAERAGVFCGGRLSPEKGILQLMEAWPADGPLLSVAGAGPLEQEVRRLIRANVRFLGELSHDDMLAAMRNALVVVMPSIWPEPLGLVAIEAFAEGTPVVAFEGWSLGSVVKQLSPRCVVPFHHFDELAGRAIEIAGSREWEELSVTSVALWKATYSHSANETALVRAYEAALAASTSRRTGAGRLR